MWPKLQLLTAAASLIGLLCLATASASTNSTNSTSSTTTSLPVNLQPPTQPQNVTMTMPMTMPTNEAGSTAEQEDDDDEALSDRAQAVNRQAAGGLEVVEDLNYGSEVATEGLEPEKQEFVGVPGFLPTTVAPQLPTNTNGHGYIQFDINEELPVQVVPPRQRQLQTKSRTETVNEVLYNLFPKGFSDIFRFSGRETGRETTTETPITTTVAVPLEPTKNQTYFSYQTTVTKEYRRELSPGHTEIVVEQISSAEHEPFKDGSNQITRDELLRINRAAKDSPVLPSLLLPPEGEAGEAGETLEAAESAPIVILGEHESDLEEGQLIEDNQIAESHAIYQQRLPPPSLGQGVESYSSQQGPGQEQQINVHIVHDDSLAQAQQKKSPSGALDHYQQHSEQQHFQQPIQSIQEAPSRQFLKNFKPIVSGSAEGAMPKGTFHYEVNNGPPKQSEYKGPFAQLDYQRDLKPKEKLNTQAVASPAPPAHYVSPTPASVTPHSLVFVTLNSPSTTPLPQAVEQPPPNLPSPHDYVSEAAAEPSQQHAQHAPAPKAQSDTQLLVKPNGYTFVEVQKSVNIHNKLITEKDGRLVEQHETIYHQPYQENYVTPEKYVASAAQEGGKNYESLAKNPINVEQEYDSSPQDSNHHHQHPPLVLAQPYPVEKIVERPVKQFIEKHIPIAYAVPQPVPVPVHVEHFVDRPYPVQTIVEQPIPYPVETVVEKIIEKHVPVEVERIVERPVHVEKIVEKFVDRPMAVPIHVPVAIHMPMPPSHSFAAHPNALPPWSSSSHSVGHIPQKVLQNYYARMIKKLLPQLSKHKAALKTSTPTVVKPPVKPVRGEAPLVATFSLADMRFDLRPPPPPHGSPWLQGARYIYNTLPEDLATAAASAPSQMVKSYIGPVPVPGATAPGNEFDEFQRWRNGHTLKRSPDFGRNLQMEYGFKPPLVPSVEIDDKGNPLKVAEEEKQ